MTESMAVPVFGQHGLYAQGAVTDPANPLGAVFSRGADLLVGRLRGARAPTGQGSSTWRKLPPLGSSGSGPSVAGFEKRRQVARCARAHQHQVHQARPTSTKSSRSPGHQAPQTTVFAARPGEVVAQKRQRTTSERKTVAKRPSIA